jgi:hypothetical protein
LFPWKPRDDALATGWLDSDKMRVPALEAFLDLGLNFEDFWNYITYEKSGLIWNRLLDKNSFEPRRKLSDSELSPDQLDRMRYTLPFEHEMEIVHGPIVNSASELSGSIEATEKTVPPELRAITLALIDLDSPYYRTNLSAAQQIRLLNQADEHSRLLEGIGFRRSIVYAKEFNEEDYIDRVHLSYRGGYKLAEIVAGQITDLSHELGYTK